MGPDPRRRQTRVRKRSVERVDRGVYDGLQKESAGRGSNDDCGALDDVVVSWRKKYVPNSSVGEIDVVEGAVLFELADTTDRCAADRGVADQYQSSNVIVALYRSASRPIVTGAARMEGRRQNAGPNHPVPVFPANHRCGGDQYSRSALRRRLV